MTLQVTKVLADLQIDDYFLGTDGETIWKIVRKRQDGYVGITNKAGDKVIVKPENTRLDVQQLHFGVDTLEELQAQAEQRIKDTLGGTVVARKTPESVEWVMPSLDEIYNDSIQLKAHLMLHHPGITMCGPEATPGDLKEVHYVAHTLMGDDAPAHTHKEK